MYWFGLAVLGVLTVLEVADPGIVSTRFPLPLLWVVWGAIVLWRSRHTGLSPRARVCLTILTALFTMAMVALLAGKPHLAEIGVVVLSGVVTALVFWTLSSTDYAADAVS